MDRHAPDVFAFTVDQVVRLTGLDESRLREWNTAGFFRPKAAPGDGRDRSTRLYSFAEVVGLRVLALLRTVHDVPLPRLEAVARALEAQDGVTRAEVRLHVVDGEVRFLEPEAGSTDRVSNHSSSTVTVADVEADVRARISSLRHRDEQTIGRIEKRRDIAGNAPVIAGTRIPVSAIVHYRRAGYSNEAILAEYPALTEADIEAALKNREDEAAA